MQGFSRQQYEDPFHLCKQHHFRPMVIAWFRPRFLDDVDNLDSASSVPIRIPEEINTKEQKAHVQCPAILGCPRKLVNG